MSVKKHYDEHLGDFYAWMAGDFATQQQIQQKFFEENKVTPFNSKLAVDLGAGHGLQAVSLANLGFHVKAIDFNPQLLVELKRNSNELPIDIIEDDITNFQKYIQTAGVIVCMGDTITHLQSFEAVEQLFSQVYETLNAKGKLIISYRDYGVELQDTQRIIPVKADESRIHTCFLEYFEDKVRVTDVLHQKQNTKWQQTASSYFKLRLTQKKVEGMLQTVGFNIQKQEEINRMKYCIATL